MARAAPTMTNHKGVIARRPSAGRQAGRSE